MSESDKGKKLDILDYGGGGGQFALVCKSLFPQALVYYTDIIDQSLLKEWKAFNIQIPFEDFAHDRTRFDVIFMNDVFEHVSNPLFVLRQLSGKLKRGGKVVIDTPRQFWIYPVTKLVSKTLYEKILKGTVSRAHLQIWSQKSFQLIVSESKLAIIKYKTITEYSMPSDFYMFTMGITNPILRVLAHIFYRNAKWIARNKIVSVLSNETSSS